MSPKDWQADSAGEDNTLQPRGTKGLLENSYIPMHAFGSPGASILLVLWLEACQVAFETNYFRCEVMETADVDGFWR